MRTGAITTRCPADPGLSTSITQPSTTVGSAMAGAMGAATASVRHLATANPRAKQASISSGSVHIRPSASHRAPSHRTPATTAPTPSGQSDGSLFSAK